MNPALVVVAVATIGGALLAVCARDVRAALLGVLIVLLGAPLMADPWPAPVAILVRIAAALLAVRLIAIGLRGNLLTGASRIGWPSEILLAGAAAVIGFGSHGLGAQGLGPAEAQAAGFALLALAVAPLFTGRDALRLAIGAVLILVAAELIQAGLDRTPSEAEQLIQALLTIALGGAVAVVVTTARAAGGLDAIDLGRFDDPGAAGKRAPDAHRTARIGESDPGGPTTRRRDPGRRTRAGGRSTNPGSDR